MKKPAKAERPGKKAIPRGAKMPKSGTAQNANANQQAIRDAVMAFISRLRDL